MYNFEARQKEHFILDVIVAVISVIAVFQNESLLFIVLPFTIILVVDSLLIVLKRRRKVIFKDGVLIVQRRFKRFVFDMNHCQYLKYNRDTEGADWLTAVILIEGKQKKFIILKDYYVIPLKDIYKSINDYLSTFKQIDAQEESELHKDIQIKFNESIASITLLAALGSSLILQIMTEFAPVPLAISISSLLLYIILQLTRKKVVRKKAIEATFNILGVLLLSISIIVFLSTI